MSRDDGFATVDLDVALLHDAKIIKLARELRDEARTAAHVGLYVGLLAESWRNGERVHLEDSLPAWWMGDITPYADALRQAGLIDAEDRIPEQSWRSWFIPAWDRRDARRREGRISGLVSHGMTRDQAEREADRRSRQGSSEVTSGSPRGVLDPSRPPGRPTPPTSPAGRGSSLPPPDGAAAVTAPNAESPRRALARAIRDASSAELRRRHLARFESQYGHLYRPSRRESVA